MSWRNVDPDKFRLEAQRPLEGKVQQSIHEYLHKACLKVAQVERYNGGAATYGDGRFVRNVRDLYGNHVVVCDLEGWLRDGRKFAVEVKRPGEAPSRRRIAKWYQRPPGPKSENYRPWQQAIRCAAIVRCGGLAGFAESVDDARAIIQDERQDERLAPLLDDVIRATGSVML